MASTIKIKRSEVSGNPAVLGAGELAYSGLTDNGSNGGDRLYIGMGTETDGNAVNHIVIGGKTFTDKLDHTPGVLTASSAIVVDASSKIDDLKVDNLQLNGNTISSTDTNGSIVITPDGTGSIVLDGQNWPQADGGANQFLKTNGTGQLSWAAIPSGSFDIAGNTGTDTFTTGDTLTFTGTAPINTVVTADTVTISAADASTSVKGVASFSSTNFSVTTGAVSIKSAGVPNDALVNSSVTVGTTPISLGSSATTLAGLSSVTSTSFVGALTGNADTATSAGKWTTSRTLTLGGDLTGNVSIDGSADVTLTATIAANSVALGTDTTGDYVAGVSATAGTGISVSGSGGETAAVTIAGIDASTTVKGVASFSSDSFSVTTGVVTVKSAGITNTQLVNSSVTIGSTTTSLGGTSTSLAGLTELSVDNLNLNNNTITATNTNGDINLLPNGTGTVSVNNARITGVAEPTNASDAATKGYVDAVAEGLHIHASAEAATTASLASLTGGTVTYNNGTAGVGATLTLSEALTTLDGYTLVNGNRIIVKDEATAAHNGIYVRTSSTVLTRATDYDTAIEIAGGDFTFVTNGTQYNNVGFVQTEAVSTVGTDAVQFIQFSGAGAYIAGNGLTLTGSTFDVNVSATGGIEIVSDELRLKSGVAGAGLTYTSGVIDIVGTANRITVNTDSIDIASTYVGQSSITTVGTLTAGTWNANTIAVGYGGTGITTATSRGVIYGNGTSAFGVTAASAIDGSFLREDSTGNPFWSNVIDGGTY